MDRLRKSIFAAPSVESEKTAKRESIGQNSLYRHGRGRIFEIFRLALTPSSLGLAQDDKRERASIQDGILVTGIFLSIPHMRTGEGACATKR